jgi:autotransporter-associated beta strand protein
MHPATRTGLLALMFLTAPFVVFKTAAAAPPGYYLVWADEFNATSLDSTKWNHWLPGRRRDAVNVANAVSLDGSNLVITTYTSNKVHYTGMIATHETFRARYGYWESRIRWGDTNGMWSAFWLQSPEMIARSPEPRLAGSEIDIAEHRYLDKDTNNIANKIQVNLHWNGYGPSSRSSGSGNVASGLADGFHTYGFLWTADSYSFMVDDARIYARGSAPISHSTEWTILSSEVDDTSTLWAGHVPAEGYGGLADSTTTMTVDYVRYYAPSNVLFWTGAESAYWTNTANWISGKLPLAGSDLIFSYLSANGKCALGRDYAINGLVLLQTKEDISIEGTNTVNLGGNGIDMSAANRALTISAPINIAAPQTWLVGQKAGALNVLSSISRKEGLTKAGPGTLLLNSSNDFSGPFNLDAGKLLVNGSLAANPLTIRGTLGGSGTISGSTVVNADGVISPGNSIGTLTFSGALTLSSNSIIFLELNNSLQTSDQLKIAGPMLYQGTLTVTNVAGQLKEGDRFKLFEATTYSGAFHHITLPVLPPDLEWNTRTLTNGILSVISATHTP